MKSILLPMDESIESSDAAEQAILIAKMLNYSVTFLIIITKADDSEFTVVPLDNESMSIHDEKIIMRYTNLKKKLDDLINSLQCQSIAVNKMIVNGLPYQKIIDESKNGDYDLIIMEHQSFKTLKQLFLGSVAKRVVENAPCSVLVVK